MMSDLTPAAAARVMTQAFTSRYWELDPDDRVEPDCLDQCLIAALGALLEQGGGSPRQFSDAFLGGIVTALQQDAAA